jgi:hypothetical protein
MSTVDVSDPNNLDALAAKDGLIWIWAPRSWLTTAPRA